MAQADQTVQNASFPVVRADINDNLAALFSQSSGSSAPAVTVAFMPWIDTSSSPAVWKVRNAANSGWITVGTIDATTFAVGGLTPIANGGTGATTAAAALAALLPAQSGQSGKSLVTDGTSAAWDTPRTIVRDTAQPSLSGTSIDFTGIPSWAKRITVMFAGVSTNGTSRVIVQLGATGIEDSGYVGSSDVWTAAPGASLYGGTGFDIEDTSAAAAIRHGIGTLVNLTGNQWVFSFTGSRGASLALSSGSKTLSDTLDRIRITTVGGTNTFDAGIINIMYEG